MISEKTTMSKSLRPTTLPNIIEMLLTWRFSILTSKARSKMKVLKAISGSCLSLRTGTDSCYILRYEKVFGAAKNCKYWSQRLTRCSIKLTLRKSCCERSIFSKNSVLATDSSGISLLLSTLSKSINLNRVVSKKRWISKKALISSSPAQVSPWGKVSYLHRKICNSITLFVLNLSTLSFRFISSGFAKVKISNGALKPFKTLPSLKNSECFSLSSLSILRSLIDSVLSMMGSKWPQVALKLPIRGSISLNLAFQLSKKANMKGLLASARFISGESTLASQMEYQCTQYSGIN